MSPQTTPIADTAQDLELAERLIAPDGTRLNNPDLDPFVADVDPAQLRALHRDMVILRRIDAEGVALQRQGQLGLWAPCNGQEASQIGTARALDPIDFVFPSYRETGVIYARGAQPGDFVRVWRGEEGAPYDPMQMRVAPLQIIIGAQALHAVGYAMGIKHEKAPEVAVTYFGDGATSQGDFHEGVNFATIYDLGVIFFCQNNEYAISVPLAKQMGVERVSERATGYGIPGITVNGLDAIEVHLAAREAVDRARRGEGPTLIEAMVRRFQPHSSDDDDRTYRAAEELEHMRSSGPLRVTGKRLRDMGVIDDAWEEAAKERVKVTVNEATEFAEQAALPDPATLERHVFFEAE